ncbi:MAG: aminoacyl-tRNA hydrolase [Patescibacteria group bacterium]
MKLIVGLGNPGKSYEKTRHNVGFMMVDKIQKELKKYNINEWEISKKFNAEICGCTVGEEKIILAKPLTFMNNSGEAVGLIMHYYKINIKDLIVVHDDKDIQLGEYKIQENKESAGHNGVKSIIQILNNKNFTRVRIGVASSNQKKMADTAKFVLAKFSLFERKKIETMIAETAKKTLEIIF